MTRASDLLVDSAPSAHRTEPLDHYNRVAVVLHWVIGAGVMFLIALGLVMTHLKLVPLKQFQLYQLHKSVGITVLLAMVLRICWRLSHRPPPLPSNMSAMERRAAHGLHALLYIFLVAMPLTGWATVSASPFNIPTVLFDVMRWPHLPIISTIRDKAYVEAILSKVHSYGSWILIGFLVIHIGAALRHHVILRDDVLWRMLPFYRRPSSRL